MENEMEEKTKLLIVDDEECICEIMQSHFERRGYSVTLATSAKQALPMIKKASPKVMLLDKRMPDMTGIDLLKLVREFNKDIRVIMISADELDRETESQIKSLDVFGYLHKPAVISDLDAMVEKAAK